MSTPATSPISDPGASPTAAMAGPVDLAPVESRPGVLFVGPPGVGKRTLLSRLVSADLLETTDLSSDVICHGWTIDTKYYTADLCIWVADLNEGLSIGSVPEQVDALVMVFDMSEPDSFVHLQKWVSGFNVQSYEILLCIGNKADRLPGHSAHREYKRRMQKHGESSSDPHPEYLDYGISESEGSSLLGEEEPSLEIKRACLEWCLQNNIEYLEACASNAVFDKCLSVDGDLQGVDRLYGALSAHIWPGMVLKSGNKIPISLPMDREGSSDEECEFEIEYEVLSKGSAEPWDNLDEAWDTMNDIGAARYPTHSTNKMAFEDQDKKLESTHEDAAGTSSRDHGLEPPQTELPNTEEVEVKANASAEDRMLSPKEDSSSLLDESQIQDRETQSENIFKVEAPLNLTIEEEDSQFSKPDEDMHMNMEDLEQLMCEISHMRENLRLMPDFQRRERAAKLAMKMAVMFADGEDEEL